jgi:CHAT domain-containing protein
MRIAVVACLLAGIPVARAAAQTPSAEGALATELRSLPDDASREAWLEAHRDRLTAALGRELGAQAAVSQRAGRFDEAFTAFALAVRVGESAGDLRSRITGLHGQGDIERQRGRAREALAFLERGLREAEAAGDEAMVGAIGTPLGSTRLQMGQYADALAIFERQRAAYDAVADRRGRAQAESNIGAVLGTMGRNEEALASFERSRALFAAEGYAPGVTRADNNLGITHRNLGNYAAALEALTRSLQAKEAAGDRPGLPSTLKNIGSVYTLQGTHDRALDYFRRSYAIAAEIGQKPAMVQAGQDEGRVLLEMGRAPEALPVLERALALAREIENTEAASWVGTALAEVHHALHDRPRALAMLEDALAAAVQRNETPLIAHNRWQIASLLLEEGRPRDALPLAEGAVQLARTHFLPETLWPALLVTARAHQGLGRPDLAEPLLREAVDVIEDLRSQTVGPDADRAAFLVSRASPYQELVALLADSGRDWEALAVAERSKGRVLLDVIGASAATAVAGDAREQAEERALEASLLAANSELRALLQKPDQDAARVKALEDERARRRRAVEDFRAREYAAHPELRALRGASRALEPADVKALLGDGRTVLLEYVLAARGAYLFVLSAAATGEPALAVHRLSATSPDLARQAADLRALLAERNLDFGAPAARLYRLLLAPAGAALQRARRVILVPDGRLWELPFQALRSASGRYLIQDRAVSYAPSLTVLRDMRATERDATPRAGTLLALGNPELGAGTRRRQPSVLMGETLEPLPEAEAQVRQIARLYDPGSTAVRVGGEARESWLKQEAPRYRVLHLATHGLLDDTSPLYSQLVLATPAAGESDDGLLEAREILDLRLRADLAVLSACETGRGQAGAGEGLIGMSWAFFVAGCPATVASQWKVDAASTGRLMVAFHRELKTNRTPAEALRLAALAQLRRPRERHPFYWAGFVAMGDADSPGR